MKGVQTLGQRVLEGDLSAADLSFGIVVSRWNSLITRQLLDGALDALKRHGADESRVTVAWCPGSFEIPVVAKALAETGNYDAVIALGCVIRGATTHYDHIANVVSSGLATISLETGVPVTFGVLTVESIEQAAERAGTKAGNKGAEAATAAMETARLLRRIAQEPGERAALQKKTA